VAFVLNKRLTPWLTDSVTYQEIVPGRALALTMNWHANETTTLINIYALPDTQKHEDFWANVYKNYTRTNVPKLDFMLGDFNIVEYALDWMPARMDPTRATDALSNLKHNLALQDTWRQTYETKREFTYFSAQNTSSRIDRIYTSTEAATSIYNWRIERAMVSTDHCLVSINYAPQDAPYIGKGRWTVNPNILANNDFYKVVIEKGRETKRCMRK
jgi:exonuclease III